MPSPSNPVLAAFTRLRVWERGGERAPHKPLLALLALGRWSAVDRTPLRFADIDRPLRALLVEFGPPRRSYHPEFPFWYLRNDGVWEVTPADGYTPRKGHSSPSAKQLRDANAAGQFSPAVRTALEQSPGLVADIARVLLEAHFPPSYHDDILAAVGLELGVVVTVKTARDRAFRDTVLTAYGCACAVCGVGVRVGDALVGVEAAHVRWHAQQGPDTVANGLCLCSLHHKLFDRGAFTLSPDAKRVWVSDLVNGAKAKRTLVRFHDRELRSKTRPSPEFVAWHHREVFKGRPRHQTDG